MLLLLIEFFFPVPRLTLLLLTGRCGEPMLGPAHPYPSGVSAAASDTNRKRAAGAAAGGAPKAWTWFRVQVLDLTGGSFLVILKAPSRKSLSGLYSFTLICSLKGVPAARPACSSHTLQAFK